MNAQSTLHLIGGESVPASSRAFFDDHNPEDDSVYAQVAHGTEADVNSAVKAAKEAFAEYELSLAKEREAWLLKAAELMEARKDQFLDALIDEIGSPIGKAHFEFQNALEMMRAAAGMARQVTGKTMPSDVPNRFSMSIRKPLGVVAAITPFNVPLIKGVRLTANALAVGNTVVLLPSEEAPVIATLLGAVFRDAGIPAGAINVVCGFGFEIGDILTGHPDVAMVTFTGSSAVGQHINMICAAQKKPVTLELGGKSPMVILADADVDKAVGAAVMGTFVYQGQICMASSRIYVEEPVFDEFMEKFVGAATHIGVGDMRDMDTVIGPIISGRQRERIKTHICDAKDKGATITAGGQWTGNRCHPTILTDVTEEMILCRNETFGPVTAVYKIASYEEGLEKANDTEFGLSSSIFTRDLEKALHFANNIGAGMCHVNGATLHDEPHVPFGGNGESGVGREGTQADIDAMTEWKWITVQL